MSVAAPHDAVPQWASEPRPKPYRSRWPLFLGVGGGLFAAAGLLAWLVLWLSPPTPARLLVYTAGYEQNLAVPQNAAGRIGSQALLTDLNSGPPSRSRLRVEASPRRFSRGTSSRFLADLREVREQTIVLFFSAHGAADDDGPYLVPDDATGDPGQRVRLKAVIEALGQLPPRTRKFVILDSTSAATLPQLGVTHNGFVSALEMLEPEIVAVPNLAILVSSSAEERSWISPEWGTTTFAHYLREGLHGSADANHDRRLDALEVIDFVSPRVQEWARDHRAARQVPRLFPTGAEGRHRASEIHLTVLPMESRAAAASPPTVFVPPAVLEQTWQEYAAAGRQQPHPSAISPGLWQEYTGWAMRHEQLVLAGSEEAESVRERVADVRRRLADARRLELESRTQTLHLASGLEVNWQGVDRIRDVARLADAAETERDKTWTSIRASFDPLDPTADQLAFGRALVRWIAEDPPTRLPRAATLLTYAEEGFRVRPAELHFLRQLSQHGVPVLVQSPLGPVVRRVLELRLLAESTATGTDADAVQPWIVEELAKGDTARRQAEDLLFASDDKSWEQSAQLATVAEGHYAAAQQTASDVRKARAIYHLSAPLLHGCAEWIADGPGPANLPERMAREADLQAASAAWQLHHRLGQTLTKPPSTASLVELKVQSEELENKLTKWRRKHREAVKALLAARPDPHDRERAVRWWLVAESVLSVPVFVDSDVATRGSLLTEWRNTSRQLLIETRTGPEFLSEPDPATVRERVFDNARRRGVLALSALGSDSFALLPESIQAESIDTLRFRYEQFARQADARSTLARADDRLGRALFAVPDVIAKQSEDATDMAPLSRAERLSRSVPFLLTTEPAVQARRIRASDLLAAQAQRSFADFWAGGPDPVPYYRAASTSLLADARRLRKTDRPEWSALAARLAETPAFPLMPQVPERLVITDEPVVALTVPFEARASGGGRPGFVAFQVVSADPEKKGHTRTIRPADSAADTLTVQVPPRTGSLPLSPVVEKDPLRLVGYFRGHELSAPLHVERHPIADSTAATRPVPAAAAVAVRVAPDAAARFAVGTGSLAFVLDASGSMRAPESQPDNLGHYTRAIERFADILRQLPRGVSISVSVFGARDVAPDNPEAAFEVVLPFTDVANINADQLMAQLRAKEPWNRSAIVRAVRRAKASLAKQPEGYHAVVLLSDCVDTRFADDRAANPKKQSIADALRATFDGSGVSLHVVAYPAGDAADAAVQGQFRVVTELKPGGLFVTPRGADEIIKLLVDASALRIRARLTASLDGKGLTLQAGAAGADNWSPTPLGAGSYLLGIENANIPLLPVELRPGERLLVNVGEEERQIRYRRVQFLRETAAVARSDRRQQPDWTFAVLENRLPQAGGLSMLAALEDADDGTKTSSPTRVGEVWFDVAPAVGRATVAARWSAEPGYPMPTWNLTTRAWPNTPGAPEPASPTVTVWWQADGPFPPTAVWKSSAETDLFKMPSTDFSVGRNRVRVESISIESHVVEVKPGVLEARKCVVVRLTSPPENTFWARTTGAAPTGSEIRIYKAANKTTSLFWWQDEPTEEQLRERVSGLEFVSLTAAKAAAVARGHTRQLQRLPSPTPLAPRPIAPAK